MATAVRKYEFKVEYGCSRNEEKWTKFYLEEHEISGFPHRDYKRIEWALREKSRDELNKSNGGSGI